MEDKLGSDGAETDSFDFIGFNFSLDLCPLAVINSQICDKEISFLFFLIVIEFKDGTAHKDSFCDNKGKYLHC